jgi:hypothetical protein
MRRHAAQSLLAALALMSGSAVAAQDAVPETPPELRDFRLDEPNPQPDSSPPTTQPVVPPPVVRTVPEPAPERTVSAPPQTAPAPRRETTRTAPDEQTPEETEASSNPILSPQATNEPLLPPAQSSQTNEADPVQPAQSEQVADQGGWIWPGMIGGIIVLALLAFLVWRRRQKNAPVVASEAVSVPDKRVTPEPTRSPPPVAVARPSPPATLPQPPPPILPDVSVQFVPEKATISFTSLTVKGQLQIANDGKALAHEMQLRAVLLSASNQQQQAIDSFFANPAQVEPTALGDARPGERLGLALELSVPLSEMQSFPLGEQRLLVPILIATLSYSDDKGVAHDARLACMIGREAKPPQPKMGPLRLDKGPRSFAPLGQRPVFT